MSNLTELNRTWSLMHLMFPSSDRLQTQIKLTEIKLYSEYASAEALLAVALSRNQFINYGIPNPEESAFQSQTPDMLKILRFVSVAQLALRASGNTKQLQKPEHQTKPNIPTQPLLAISDLILNNTNSLRTSEKLDTEYPSDFERAIIDNSISTRGLLSGKLQFVGIFASPISFDQALATQMLYLRATDKVHPKREQTHMIDLSLEELAKCHTAFQN